MLNLKKVIASICVIAMVLSTVAFGATYTDVAEDNAYYEAVETLSKLDIVTGYEDGNYKPEDGVTRAEMAALIARIQGYGETANGSVSTGFTDVPASHWASGYIANAAGMGIINGYGDGTFGPEDPVLFEQAVKMVMASLGYTPFAEKNGGYPTGYLAAAQRYDVTLAVANAAVGKAANRGTVAQILANAIDTPLMVQSRWNTSGEVEYVIADGKNGNAYKTLMSENLGFVKIRGIVEENSVTSINGAKTVDTTADAKVVIDVMDAFDTSNKDFVTDAAGKITTAPTDYLVGETDAEEYLGRSVIAYVKKVGNNYKIVSIAIDTARNSELTIDLDQYEDETTTEVKYWKDGANDTTTIRVKSGYDVVLNADGGAIDKVDEAVAHSKLFGGQVTFIDNDDTKGYDIAFVDLASTGVVKKVTEDGIYFHNNVTFFNDTSAREIELDAEDETRVVAIYKDGEAIETSELEEWDVLSIYATSEEASVIVADVVANQVVGTISSRKASDKSAHGGYAYKIADTWYDVALGAYGYADLDVREGGTFYIDEFGKIAAFVEDSALAGGTTANYAYILGASAKKAEFGGSGFDVKLQIVTADGVSVVSVKSNARLELAGAGTKDIDLTKWVDTDNNGSFNDGDTGYADFKEIEEMEGAVVQYVANSTGVISRLTEAGFDADFEKLSGAVSGKEYDADNNKFASIGYVDSDAIVFIIGDATDSRVGTLADLDDGNGYDFIGAWADKKAEDCNVIAITASSIKAGANNIAVIKEVGDSTNEADEAVLAVTYLYNGEEITAETTADVYDDMSSSLTEGDIVKVKVDAEGVITNMVMVYNFGAGIRTNNTPATINGADGTVALNEAFAGGIVTNYKESSTEATILGTAYKLSRAANVYVVDVNGRTTVIKNGSDGNFKYFGELYEGNPYVDLSTNGGTSYSKTATATAQAYADHVYVRTYENKVTDVVIVKGADIKVRVNAD